MNLNLIEGIVLILTGITMLVVNLRGTHFVFYLFDVFPIPLSFWMPIAMVMLGGYMMTHQT